jgi:hypothetical protein
MKNKQYLNEVKRFQKIAGILKEDDQPGTDITPEKAADIATKLTDKIKSNPKIIKFADAVAKDPAATKQLTDLLAKYNVSLNEDVNNSDIHSLALAFAKKADTLKEDEGVDVPANEGAAGLFLGLLGGGALADKFLTYNMPHELGDMLDKTASLIPGLSAAGTDILGSLLGATLGCIAGFIIQNYREKNEQLEDKELDE